MHNKLMEGPEPADSLDANVAHSTENRSDLLDNAPYVSRAKGKISRSRWWISFLRSACGSDEIMSSGALHQIATGRVCNNNVDQGVPHRSIRNHNIDTAPRAPREPMKEGSQCAPDVRADATHE